MQQILSVLHVDIYTVCIIVKAIQMVLLWNSITVFDTEGRFIFIWLKWSVVFICSERTIQQTYQALQCEVTRLHSELKHQTGLIRKLQPLISETRQGEAHMFLCVSITILLGSQVLNSTLIVKESGLLKCIILEDAINVLVTK